MAETNLPKPTDSTAEGSLPLASIVDAVNDIPNEAARRMAISSLKRREPKVLWVTKPGGYLDAEAA